MVTSPHIPGDAYVVCQTPAEASLVEPLVVSMAHPVQVLVADDPGHSASLARTLLVTTSARVAVTLDADLDREVGRDLEAALADMAVRSRWGVFVVDPSVERLAASGPAHDGEPLRSLAAFLNAAPTSRLAHAG